MVYTILIVDDDRVSCILLKSQLQKNQYNVIVAKDGLEGLEKFDTERPDLLILDVHMPSMNGYEFMLQLRGRDHGKDVPVIMVTANETMEEIFKMEGVQDYFVKPVNFDKLKRCICDYFDNNK